MDTQDKNVRSSSHKSKKSSVSGYSTGKEELAGGNLGDTFNYDLNDRQSNTRLSLPMDLRGQDKSGGDTSAKSGSSNAAKPTPKGRAQRSAQKNASSAASKSI